MWILVYNSFATKLAFVKEIWCGEFFFITTYPGSSRYSFNEVCLNQHEKELNAITCSMLTIETLEQGGKYVES